MKKTYFRKVTVQEMLISAFLIVLIVITKQNIFTINMGIMRVGITYTFIILAGLILNFFIGLITVILGDFLGLLISGGIGTWHYAYIIIVIGIFISSFLFRGLFKIKKHNYKLLIFINLIFFLFLFVILVFLLIFKNNFIYESKATNNGINFTDMTAKILVWLAFILMTIYSILITYFYAKYKTNKWKDYIVINIIISFVFIVFIWYSGPVAQILWLSDKAYWRSFSLFQIARILKTPIMFPIYSFIVISVYKIYKQVAKNSTKGW